MITASGVGSGLDIEGLVTQLIAAERAPTENRLTRQTAQLSSELSAFGLFKNALSNFQGSIAQVNTLGNFGQRLSASDNEDLVQVSTTADAEVGSYNVGVTQLAQSQALASGSFASTSAEVGTGVLTFRFGNTDYTSPDPGPESYNGFTVNPERGTATITIDSSNNTLEGLRDAVNDADIGVSATIVNDGSGYRLLFNSEQTGADNSMEISVDDSGDGNSTDASGLSALAFNASATNLSQTVAAQDAVFSINGLSINSADNRVSDAIEGVELNLRDVTGAANVVISVAEDRGGVKEAITSFVDGYNQFVNTANALTAYDPASGTASALQGDFSARSIVGQLRAVMVSAVEGFNGPFNSLSEIGITTAVDGTLSVDSSRLDKVLDENFEVISGMFAAVGFPSDSGVDFLGASDETAVASYDLNITQMASRGQVVGAAAGFPLDIDDDNDNFVIKVDGTSSGTISLTQGTYASGAELAAELQSRINGDSAISGGGIVVDVQFNVDRFEITSQRWGSGSSVELESVDTNTVAELGLSVGLGTLGVDVAGTIGGVAASGVGQVLTGVGGSNADGLRLLIDGGTVGARGTVDFSRGLSAQLDALLSGFLDAEGILESRTGGIQQRVDEIGDAREALDRRMELLEAQYRQRFTNLDILLANLQSTSSFLTQQLASLPEPNSVNR